MRRSPPPLASALLLGAALLGAGPRLWPQGAQAQGAPIQGAPSQGSLTQNPPGLGSGAQLTSERLQALERELIQQRRLSRQQAQSLERVRAQLRNLSTRQRAALDRLDQLAAQVAGLENELAALADKVAKAEKTLREVVARREVTEARVESLKADVRGILNALYRERGSQYLRLLSQASSLSDLLIRLDYANMQGQHNLSVMEQLRDLVAELETQQREQEAVNERLRKLQTEQRGKLAEMRASRAQQEAFIGSLKQTVEGQQAFAVRTQAQQVLTAKTIDGLVGQVLKEQARLEAERQRRLEEERRRREEEARRLREAQERARQEQARLARLRAEQERRAREAEAKRLQEARAAAARQAQEQAAARAAAQQAAQRDAQEQAAQQAAAQQAAAQQAADAQSRRAAAEQERRAAALAREQAALQKRQAEVRQEETQAATELAPLAPAGGPLGFPLPGGQVAAGFGDSGGDWVILSAPEGTQAVAALSGNVLAATFYAALGWVVLIDNGGGTVTGYFGLQEAAVNVGERVGKGAPVGTIGGSHIFGLDRMAFQLRRDGTPVPPQF